MDKTLQDESIMSSQSIIIQIVKWRTGGANRPDCIKRLLQDFLDMDKKEAKQLVDTAWFYN